MRANDLFVATRFGDFIFLLTRDFFELEDVEKDDGFVGLPLFFDALAPLLDSGDRARVLDQIFQVVFAFHDVEFADQTENIFLGHLEEKVVVLSRQVHRNLEERFRQIILDFAPNLLFTVHTVHQRRLGPQKKLQIILRSRAVFISIHPFDKMRFPIIKLLRMIKKIHLENTMRLLLRRTYSAELSSDSTHILKAAQVLVRLARNVEQVSVDSGAFLFDGLGAFFCFFFLLFVVDHDEVVVYGSDDGLGVDAQDVASFGSLQTRNYLLSPGVILVRVEFVKRLKRPALPVLRELDQVLREQQKKRKNKELAIVLENARPVGAEVQKLEEVVLDFAFCLDQLFVDSGTECLEERVDVDCVRQNHHLFELDVGASLDDVLVVHEVFVLALDPSWVGVLCF